ncbi:helix-turn-helix transcriptional regulator [Streptomyces sp. CA-250714]|uniref:helix-turn-helix transcriptional regulator n=1 Tax=Streptomyces sp. CA-250714 TaxID=3240060 RepID=UPI003D8D827C
MGLAERRKALGYSQEGLAHVLGVDRTTVGRWEKGKGEIQPSLRARYAAALQLDLAELDVFLSGQSADPPDVARRHPGDHYGSRDIDDMIRREFLRVLAVAGALTAEESEALAEGVQRRASTDFARMNEHLWQVYQLARTKGSVYPVVRDQLSALARTLDHRTEQDAQALCGAAGDLFQLAGELAFDGNRYPDAAASYMLAASASKEARAFDLWACALTRHAYLDVYERRYRDALDVLSAAERIARRGDRSLATRHWVAAVQAEAFAGIGDLTNCERALDEAEKVADLSDSGHNGGWLRFDGTRLAEERGARYVQLGRLDLAERTLQSALSQGALAHGHSFRRRGAVLTNLAAIGAKRNDPDQVITYAQEALHLAVETSSGYVARRLQALCADFGPLARDGRIAGLEADIKALGVD